MIRREAVQAIQNRPGGKLPNRTVTINLPWDRCLRYLVLVDIFHMVHHGTLPLICAVKDAVRILGRLARGQLLTILPDEIGRGARAQGGLLPLQLVGAVIALHAILLKQAWLTGSLAGLGVVLNPSIAPGVVLDTPYSSVLDIVYLPICHGRSLTVSSVKVESSEVNVRDSQVLLKVVSFAGAVRVRLIRADGQAHAL